MAIYSEHGYAADVVGAAQQWRDRCLISDGSILADEPLWSQANFESLKRAFVDNPLEGSDDFYTKLEQQLSGASPELKRLAGECVWLLLLFVHRNKYRPSTKVDRVRRVWEWSGTPLPQSPLLRDAPLSGVGGVGQAFLNRIWAEFGYLVTLMSEWKQLPVAEQRELALASDPWLFCSWVTARSGQWNPAFRHMLLYFCFPEQFERICSRKHKEEIYKAYRHVIAVGEDAYASHKTPCALDQSLLAARRALEQQYGGTELDFYREPLREAWRPSSIEVAPATEDEGSSDRRYWIEKSIVAGRPDRSTGDHQLGQALWSPQRSSSGGDIYAKMREVRPGDVVFHLTDNAGITDVSVVAAPVDETFTGVGGTPWSDRPCYRVQLKNRQQLSPKLEREAFLKTEPFGEQLKALAETSRGLFFNSQGDLNQGAYLTEATPALLSILNAAYRNATGQSLPYVDEAEPTREAVELIAASYTVDDVLEDLFLERDEVDDLLTLWSAKKNIVVQGPPGVGKSFAAQRLAYALIGAEDHKRVGFVQFHQSYAYEDFVQGYRPASDGFALKDGKFVDFCAKARARPNERHVFIIDEINRGNLSKILGELMLLIESDKRTERWAMPLAYGDATFYVPGNVFLLGLMNTADRSLAVVDYALRRRFAFIDLTPRLGSPKFAAELARCGVDGATIAAVRNRVGALNEEIERDIANLGPGFAIGHSFFCAGPVAGEASSAWYLRVIKTEILPLLREYWFDAPTKVDGWADRLLAPL